MVQIADFNVLEREKMSKQNFQARRPALWVSGAVVACSFAVTSAFGPAAMASETPDVATPENASVEVVDIRVPEGEAVQAPAQSVLVEQPPVTTTEPQAVTTIDVPTQVAPVTTTNAPAPAEVVVQTEAPAPAPAPSAPVDSTAPTVTIKTGAKESVQSNNQYGFISFKLFDAGKIDKVELNGVVKDLSNNTYSDLNGVKPGVYGAVHGKNVLKVYDVAGNVTTVEFTLDNVGPSASIKVDSTIGNDGIYQKVSFKLNDPANVVMAIINGVEKPLTPNVWSDLNNIVPGTFGAVEGLNTLVLVDALGNQSSSTFTLDTTKPVLNLPAAGQAVSGTYTWNLTETEANSGKVYVEIQQLIDGKWKKITGTEFKNTNTFPFTVDTTKLQSGVQTQLKVSSTDKAGNHTSATTAVIIDNVAPTITLKPESIGSEGVYRSASFKLFDGLSGVDKVTVNGVEKDLTNNKWSDLNNLKPRSFGAVEGENTIVVYDVAGNSATYVITLDSTAPTATGFTQVYEAKQDGRIAVTLTFNEKVSDLGQGWYGSGTTWTKAYYSSKEHTVTFKDAAGNSGSYTFTVDATAPVVTDIKQEWQSDKKRNVTTLTFSEPTTIDTTKFQGWTVVPDTNNTVWWKAIYNTKQYTVEYTDAIGNPGTYSFKAKGQSELNPPVVTPQEPQAPVVETPNTGSPSGNSSNGSSTTPASQVGGSGQLALTGGSGLLGLIYSGIGMGLSGLLLLLRRLFG